MTGRNFYEVSDSIKALMQLFRMQSEVHLNGEGVDEIVRELKRIHNEARLLENEVSAQRWNQTGAPDVEELVLEEAHRKGTNLRLFAPPRPAFSDGKPKGAA